MQSTRDDGAGQMFDVVVLGSTADEVLVALRGECDLAAVDPLRAALTTCLESRPPRLVLDLSRLEFLDCAALDVVLETTRRNRAMGGNVVVRGPQRIVRRVLELSGATDELEIHHAGGQDRR